MDNNNKFKFYLPADILKSTNPSTGEVEMKIKGIASDNAKDKQGEYLDPSGFDLSEFRWLNWNHLGKSDAATIIGEPTLAKITPANELYIEGILYPELPMAQSTFALMQALAKSPSGNKLSLSVEGKVLERDVKNPKRIIRSKITAVAICPVPVNSNTWVDLISKGVTDNEDNVEYDEDTKKAIAAEGSMIVRDDVEGIKSKKMSLRKSDVYDRIFNQYPDIDLEKAKSVYKLIENIATMNTDAKTVSDETIKKSFEILGLAQSEIEKSEKEKQKAVVKETSNEDQKEEKEEEEEDNEMTEKACSYVKGMEKEGKSKDVMKAALMKKGYGETVINKALAKIDSKADSEVVAKKKDIEKSFEVVTELVKAQSEDVNAKFSAIGEIMKAQLAESEELKKSLEVVNAANIELKKELNAILSQPSARKSLSSKSFVERFEKSEDGKAIYNINSKPDRKALQTRLMDLSGIQKGEGFDKSLTRVAQDLELTGQISPRDIQKLADLDIKVVIG